MALMRIRTIKPEFYGHEILAFLPDAVQLFYISLWLQCDRRGRLEDRPLRIRSVSYPYGTKTQADVDSYLSTLEQNGFIIRYQAEVNNRTVGIILCPGFINQQQAGSLAKEPESQFPPPEGYTWEGFPCSPKQPEIQYPGMPQDCAGDSPDAHKEDASACAGVLQEDAGGDPGGHQKGSREEGKGRERKGKEEEAAAPSTENQNTALTTEDGFAKALRATIDAMNIRNGKPFYDGWGREKKATKTLETLLRARASPAGTQEGLIAYAKAFFHKARELKASETFPMKGQPFTAGTLSSSGIFTRIAELAEKDQETESADWIEDPAEAVT